MSFQEKHARVLVAAAVAGFKAVVNLAAYRRGFSPR